jgi:NTE family protein
MLVHGISNEKAMSELSVASKLNADWEFLTYLRDIGRAAAEEWLGANFGRLGKETTIDLHQTYL